MDNEKFDLGDKDDLEKLKEKFKGEATAVSLHMNRVPKHVRDNFVELAEAKFADDYGMALAFLLEREKIRSQLDAHIENLNSRIQTLENAVDTLMAADEEDEEKSDDGLQRLNG